MGIFLFIFKNKIKTIYAQKNNKSIFFGLILHILWICSWHLVKLGVPQQRKAIDLWVDQLALVDVSQLLVRVLHFFGAEIFEQSKVFGCGSPP